MNKFLADAAGTLNIVVALVLIAGGASVGAGAGAMGRDGDPTGLLMGALGGGILAVLVCGGLAILIAIRDEVRTLRLELAGTAPHSGAGAPPGNTSPTLGDAAAPPETVSFEGRDVPLRNANDRQFAVLEDGRVLLKTKMGDLRTFDDLTSAERYAGVTLR